MSGILKPVLGSQLQLGHPLSTGLKLCLLANEGSGKIISDLSGNSSIGTFNGTPTWIAGKFGSAISLEAGDYVLFANESLYDFEYNHPFSVSFWYKGIDAKKQLISKQGNSAPYRGWALWIENNAGRKMRFELFSDNSPAYSASIQTVATGFGVTDWLHIIATHSGSGTIAGLKLYTNGTLEPTATIADNLASNTILNNDAVQLNGRGGGNTDCVCYMDNVTIYDREIFAPEAAQLCREPFAMFDRDPIELWSAASPAAAAAPAGQVIMINMV